MPRWEAVAISVMQLWVDPLPQSEAFDQLKELFESRIAFIDGAMGTSIQKYKCGPPCQGCHWNLLL